MNDVDWGSWLPVVAAALVALLVVSVPGVHTARSLGFDVVDSLCVGPAVGYTYLLTTGMGVTLLGLAWTPLIATAFFLATWTLGVVLSRAVSRRWRVRDARQVTPWSDRTVRVLGLLALASFAASATAIIVGIRTPEAIPQLGDTLFHVQAVQLLSTEQSANFLDVGATVWYSHLIYPGGFHVLAATLYSWTGLSTLAASHAALLVFCAGVWPLSMTFLVRSVVGSRGPWLVAGPLLAVSIQFVPAYFLGTGGPLWSHLASLALLPVPLGCVALVVLRTRPPEAAILVRAVLVAGIVMCAVIACQPNGLYSMAIVGLSLSAPSILRWGRSWRVAWGIGLLVAVLAWSTTRAAMLAIEYPVRTTWFEALLQMTSASPTFGVAGAVFAMLLLIGLITCLQQRRLHGLALAWLACALLTIAVRLGDSLLRLTWPWWSDPSRIIALLSVLSVCGAAVGLGRLAALAPRAIPSRPLVGLVPALVVLPLAIAACVSTTATTAHGYRPPDQDEAWVTDAELKALDTLADQIPRGSVIATSPFGGATFISLKGFRVVPMGPRYPLTEETALVENELDQLTDSPEVCIAAETLDVTYVITGGDTVAEGAGLDSLGIKAVGESSDFPVVATAGPYELHRVPECSTIAD